MSIITTDSQNYNNIAKAIQETTGSNDTYKPSEMADGVRAARAKGVEDGKQAEYDAFWDAHQRNGDRTDYRYAFALWSVGADSDVLNPKYVVRPSGVGAQQMFFLLNSDTDPFDFSKIAAKFDFSRTTGAACVFQSANVENVTADFSAATTLDYAFAADWSAVYGKNISIKVGEACSLSYAFYALFYLENLTFLDGSVIGKNIDVHWSNKLTHASLMSIINALKDYSGSGATYTCILGPTNLAKLTDAEKAIATQKGWTLA